MVLMEMGYHNPWNIIRPVSQPQKGIYHKMALLQGHRSPFPVSHVPSVCHSLGMASCVEQDRALLIFYEHIINR